MRHDDAAKLEQSTSSRQLKCPRCRRSFPAPIDEAAKSRSSFPFCSERCKLIDLGAWLDAEYRIPSRLDEESEEALVDPFDDPDVTG